MREDSVLRHQLFRTLILSIIIWIEVAVKITTQEAVYVWKHGKQDVHVHVGDKLRFHIISPYPISNHSCMTELSGQFVQECTEVLSERFEDIAVIFSR